MNCVVRCPFFKLFCMLILPLPIEILHHFISINPYLLFPPGAITTIVSVFAVIIGVIVGVLLIILFLLFNSYFVLYNFICHTNRGLLLKITTILTMLAPVIALIKVTVLTILILFTILTVLILLMMH